MNIPKKPTHRQRETCGRQRRVGRGSVKDWALGISRCELLYIGWINNEDLLCNTGNYILYSAINHNGRESEKNIYLSIYK